MDTTGPSIEDDPILKQVLCQYHNLTFLIGILQLLNASGYH